MLSMLDDRPPGGIQGPVAMEDFSRERLDATGPERRSERPCMKARWILVITLIAVTAQGCGFGQRFVNKKWGNGTYIPAAVCAVVGGFAGAAIESEGFSGESIRSGQSCTDVNGVRTCVHDDPDYPAAAAIGAGAGALLCGVIGH